MVYRIYYPNVKGKIGDGWGFTWVYNMSQFPTFFWYFRCSINTEVRHARTTSTHFVSPGNLPATRLAVWLWLTRPAHLDILPGPLEQGIKNSAGWVRPRSEYAKTAICIVGEMIVDARIFGGPHFCTDQCVDSDPTHSDILRISYAFYECSICPPHTASTATATATSMVFSNTGLKCSATVSNWSVPDMTWWRHSQKKRSITQHISTITRNLSISQPNPALILPQGGL